MNRALHRALLALGLGVLVGAALTACSRRAEIYDEPDSGISTGPGGPVRDKPFTPIDAGIDESELPACIERSEGECRGPNDFPCDFKPWVSGVLEACTITTRCRPNGWLAAEIAGDGCLLGVEMTEPTSAYADCVSQRLREVRCPCPASRFEQFLGTGNPSCSDGSPKPCQTGEFACDTGETCVNGLCVRDGAGGAP